MSKSWIVRIIAGIIILIVMIGAVVYSIKSPHKDAPTVETIEGFSTITSVAGCTFMINEDFVDKATAVTQISEGVNFSADDFYSYKNGKDQYMLFCMNNDDGIVVAVEKGTHFDLKDAENPNDAIKNADVMGIWFGTDKEGLKLDVNDNKCDGQVTAQVVITNELYNDFIGKIITLRNNDEEWSMFVGIPGNRYKKLSKNAKAGIEAIASSFHLSDNTGELQEPEYAVVIDGTKEDAVSSNTVSGNVSSLSDKEDVPEVVEVSKETITPAPTPVTVSMDNIETTDAQVSDNIAEDVTESTQESGDIEVTDSKEDEETNEQDKDTMPAPYEEETEGKESEEEISEEKEETIEFGESETLETTDITGLENKVKTESTVKKDWDDNKAYSSNIYSMLNVGQVGLFEAISRSNKDTGKEQLMVKITKVLDSKNTEKMIEEATKINALPVKYYPAPSGCHWESIVYSVNFGDSNYEPYTNVKLVGADGKALKYRGIKYPTRTFDVYTGKRRGSWKDGMIVYYAIPNGCEEYVLKIGDGDNINNWQSAYFFVKRDKPQ